MSTASIIGVLLPEYQGFRKLKVTSCHWNGTVNWNGMMLRRYYNSPEMAEALVDAGEISVLRERLAPYESEHPTLEKQIRGKPVPGDDPNSLSGGTGRWISEIFEAIAGGKSVDDAFRDAPKFPTECMGVTFSYQRDGKEKSMHPYGPSLLPWLMNSEAVIKSACNEAFIAGHAAFASFVYVYDCTGKRWYVMAGSSIEPMPLDDVIYLMALAKADGVSQKKKTALKQRFASYGYTVKKFLRVWE